MKLIMENWRRYIEEMLNAPIKDRPALHIYPDDFPDQDKLIDPAGQLDPVEAEKLRVFLDNNIQKIGKDRDRDIAIEKYTERLQGLLDQIDAPQQNRSPEEIQKFKEIDNAVKDIQAQIQMNLMKSRIGSADTVDSTADYGTPEKNIKTVMDFPPV